MKGLISLAIVVAFFVTIPQCLGQDACQSPTQLLEEQQLVQMFHLVMAQQPDMKICHVTPRSPNQGVILLVNDRNLIVHLNHGDCENYSAVTVDEPGRSCSCRCPGGGVPPCD